MILDSIDALSKYEALNPRFRDVVEFIERTDLNALPVGIHEISGKDVYVNIQEMKPRSIVEARWESHRQMTDIQLLLSGDEQQGWLPLAAVPEAHFDEQNDIAFYDGYEQTRLLPVMPAYFTVNPGQMAIYFPHDVHKPAITKGGLRKAIFKVRNN